MLAGSTVLIVEAEYLVALDLQNSLQASGAGKVILARNPSDALEKADEWMDATLAIVELEADRPQLRAFADLITRAGISVIGLTTDERLAERWPDRPILLKPGLDQHLAEAIRRALDGARQLAR
jgi:hypothetical protein